MTNKYRPFFFCTALLITTIGVNYISDSVMDQFDRYKRVQTFLTCVLF